MQRGLADKVGTHARELPLGQIRKSLKQRERDCAIEHAIAGRNAENALGRFDGRFFATDALNQARQLQLQYRFAQERVTTRAPWVPPLCVIVEPTAPIWPEVQPLLDPDSGVQRRGKYLGLTEAGRTLTGRLDIATGLDHLTDLGINVVQLMPVSEFHGNAAEDLYGWGYDVVHHFSPAGWYSTERNDASRVSELKRVVSALHDRGIRVTLDVVLNHTFELINKGLVFSFEGLVPGYYYRLKPDGSYWDGSGCGNEFRSESPMGRRYILDCLSYWVTEYGIDGFRIDLLGLMDFGTMQAIVDAARQRMNLLRMELLGARVRGDVAGTPPVVFTDLGIIGDLTSTSFFVAANGVRWIRFQLPTDVSDAAGRYLDIDTEDSMIPDTDMAIFDSSAARSGAALVSVRRFSASETRLP